MLLAKRIKAIRKMKKISQADVADKCDISTSAYGQIERRAGKCTFETLHKIANALGVSVSYLVDIDNEIKCWLRMQVITCFL